MPHIRPGKHRYFFLDGHLTKQVFNQAMHESASFVVLSIVHKLTTVLDRGVRSSSGCFCGIYSNESYLARSPPLANLGVRLPRVVLLPGPSTLQPHLRSLPSGKSSASVP